MHSPNIAYPTPLRRRIPIPSGCCFHCPFFLTSPGEVLGFMIWPHTIIAKVSAYAIVLNGMIRVVKLLARTLGLGCLSLLRLLGAKFAVVIILPSRVVAF